MMPTDEAREFCDEMQHRCDEMGDRVGETARLGRAVSIIRGYATAFDDPDTLNARIAEIQEKREAEKRAAEQEAAEAKKRKKRWPTDMTPPRLDE